MRGKGGRFGTDGVVGVSTGDCGCSCILMVRLSEIERDDRIQGGSVVASRVYYDTCIGVSAFVSSFETSSI